MLGRCRLLEMILVFFIRFFIFGPALSSDSDCLIIGNMFGFLGLCVETNVKMSLVFSFTAGLLVEFAWPFYATFNYLLRVTQVQKYLL